MKIKYIERKLKGAIYFPFENPSLHIPFVFIYIPKSRVCEMQDPDAHSAECRKDI